METVHPEKRGTTHITILPQRRQEEMIRTVVENDDTNFYDDKKL